MWVELSEGKRQWISPEELEAMRRRNSGDDVRDALRVCSEQLERAKEALREIERGESTYDPGFERVNYTPPKSLQEIARICLQELDTRSEGAEDG